MPTDGPQVFYDQGGTVPRQHAEQGIQSFPATAERGKRYVAWCTCGMGSPLKASYDEARASLAPHIANPRVFPE